MRLLNPDSTYKGATEIKWDFDKIPAHQSSPLLLTLTTFGTSTSTEKTLNFGKQLDPQDFAAKTSGSTNTNNNSGLESMSRRGETSVRLERLSMPLRHRWMEDSYEQVQNMKNLTSVGKK